MKINERLYPHPVLAHFSDDLTGCVFQITPKIHPTKNAYKLRVRARTSSRDLAALVVDGKAAYGIHVECATTRFRQLFISTDADFSDEIQGEKLDGRVEICTLIVATEDLPAYKNSNFHPDYGDIAFFVKKGDVLAVGTDIFFDATKDIDPLQNVASIFRVRPNLHEAAPPFVIDLQDHYVIILLSQQNFKAYSQLRVDQDKQATLASMIVTPALVHIIGEIKASSDENDFYDRRWFKVVSRKLKALGCDPSEDSSAWSEDSPVVLAQLLIGDPLSSSLQLMMEVEDEETDD